MQFPNKAADLLAKQVDKLGIPSSVTFQVTDRCNYSCTHCYQEHKADNELSTSEIDGILGQLADAGVLFLTLVGGEFFMRPDADKILQRAHQLGFALTLLTTGHHIHDKRADFLATMQPLQVNISIYGSKPAIHEAVTDHVGSWKRSYDAIKRLISRGVPVVLKTPVMSSNLADAKAIASMANSLGVAFTFDPKITAIEDGDLSTTELRMDTDELATFYGEVMANEIDGAFTGNSSPGARPLDATPCRAGQAICSITPRGKVWPCNSLPLAVGDLREQSFLSIWHESSELKEVQNLSWAKLSECNRCALRAYCSRCHGMALIEDGTMQGPSLEACRHAVAIRDSLRQRGKISATETQLPPTWNRVSADGQHGALAKRGQRSAALRILPS